MADWPEYSAKSWQQCLCGSLLFILEQKNEHGKQIFATCFCSRRRPSLTSGSASPYRNSPGWRLTLIRNYLSAFSQLHSTTNGKYAGLSLPITYRWARPSPPRLPWGGGWINETFLFGSNTFILWWIDTKSRYNEFALDWTRAPNPNHLWLTSRWSTMELSRLL